MIPGPPTYRAASTSPSPRFLSVITEITVSRGEGLNLACTQQALGKYDSPPFCLQNGPGEAALGFIDGPELGEAEQFLVRKQK